MKYRLIAMLAAVVLLLVPVVAYDLGDNRSSRVHQHLQPAPDASACVHAADTLCSHLPLIEIETGGQRLNIRTETAPVNEIVAQLKVFDSKTGNNHLSDTPAAVSLARINYRGNSSMYFDKKSYKLNLIYSDHSENKDFNLLGMGEHDEWALNGPFLDKTLLRNYVGMNIAGEIRPDTPDVRFCEVVADGEYQGVYLAMETVARGPGRVEINRYQRGDAATSYILRADRAAPMKHLLENFTRYTMSLQTGVGLEICYPSEALTDERLFRYIEQDFSKFEKALYSYDYDDLLYGYDKNINVASFVDYYIINEFFANLDAGLFSTYFYRDVKGKIQIGPVWDFNNAIDNYIETPTPYSGFYMIERQWYTMLTKDEAFVKAVISRYRELRKTILSEEYLLRYIDETTAFLGEAKTRNFAVWGYSFDPAQLNEENRLHPIERNPANEQEALDQLKQFIVLRGNWLDQNIENLKQFSHESRVKEYNH